MMKPTHAAIGWVALLFLGGCATVPTGPSVMALPGSGKTFEQFRYDAGDCQHYASLQVGGATAEQSANDSTIRSAALGTALGAAAGAAIGGNSSGTGVGAGIGLLFGALMGSDTGQYSAYSSQKRYDNAYVQCMYAKGHKVPVSASMGQMLQRQSQSSSIYSPPATAKGGDIPPPPAGNPPPPPPGY